MCLVARAGPCDAESPATQEDDHAALCWQALRTNRHGSARSTYRKAMPARQPLEMPGCYGFHSTRPARGAPVDRPARCWRTDARRPSRSRRVIDYMPHMNDACAPSPNTVLRCKAGGRVMATTVAGPAGSQQRLDVCRDYCRAQSRPLPLEGCSREVPALRARSRVLCVSQSQRPLLCLPP